MLDSNYEIGFDYGVKNVRRELIRLREPYLRIIAKCDCISTEGLAKLDLLNELIDYTNEVLEVAEDEI